MAAAARGRPKGSTDKPWRQAVDIALKRKDAKGIRMLQHAAEALVKAAVEGDPSALRELGDRIDGKVPQAVDANVTGGININILRFSDRDRSSK